MKPKHQRLVFILVSMVFLCAAVLLGMRAFRDNLVFFYSPSDIVEKSPASSQRLRIGGLVKTGSIEHLNENTIHFIVTDNKNELTVEYSGLLPNLFHEGQGVIAEGYLNDPHMFAAQKILAKHDEKYMPKEVVDALKRSGNWHASEEK